ncbi:hypothetical protein OG21DRAFT_1516676 [Imleria badia]|nr:hypothetical protein OG21DRAFT_1516676 [Imleria badia]
MFARFTSVFIALFAMIGVVAAVDGCTTVCCKSASDAPTGWQGTECTIIAPDETCLSCHTKLCCYDIVQRNDGTAGGVCTEPIKN